MNIRYQVFVSSTYDDLRDERGQVVRAVLEMGHIPVGMEMFSAADEQQWQIISRHIESSDYYVLIVAHRYGSMEGERSYTEKEYDYAIQCGLPVLGFVLDESAPWLPAKFEKDQRKRDALAQFKEKVKTRYISYWTSAADLYGKVSIALTKQITAHPRTGWVRADQVAGPEVLSELARLSKENSELHSELEVARRNTGRDAIESWSEFLDKVYDYSQALDSQALDRNRVMRKKVMSSAEGQRLEDEVEAKFLALDKMLVKLEIAFRGSDQDENLERAYALFQRIYKGQEQRGEIMGFARTIAATFRRPIQESA